MAFINVPLVYFKRLLQKEYSGRLYFTQAYVYFTQALVYFKRLKERKVIREKKRVYLLT